VRSQKLLSVTEATAGCTRKHARGCVRPASGLVLTRNSEKADAERLEGIRSERLVFTKSTWPFSPETDEMVRVVKLTPYPTA